MKTFSSSDSLGALISICSTKDDNQVHMEEKPAEKNQCYSREFQAMLDSLDQEDCGEEFMAKKRRLSSDQVKALERNFEVENKLEPERKIKLAGELGLQPRQVAIWFQNRRARWKTKQLERDYNVLKSNFDSLKLNYNNIQQHNEVLNEKLRQLKAKINRETTESSQYVKEESPISGYESNALDQGKDSDFQENSNKEELKTYTDFRFKDGSFSNEVKREERNNANYCIGLNVSSSSSSSNSLMNWFQLSDSGGAMPIKMCQAQIVRMEEQSLFSTEESCNFFSVDQAPTLHCYFPEQ